MLCLYFVEPAASPYEQQSFGCMRLSCTATEASNHGQ
jgi:hypothetical protein